MVKQPTVYDVAELAGVSIATVSRFHRTPDTVSPRTRRAIESAVAELGYVPSVVARGLAEGRSDTLALCLMDLDGLEGIGPLPPSTGLVEILTEEPPVSRLSSDLYYGELLRGAEIESWSRGVALSLTLIRTRLTWGSLRPLLGRVDGLIVLAGTFEGDAMADVARRMPVVVIGDGPVDAGMDQIRTDNRAGLAALVSHLIDDHAIRRPVFIDGPPGSRDSQQRALGFADAVGQAGLGTSALPVVHGDFTRLGGRAAARAVLARGDLPEAVICANDQTALGVLDVLRSTGLRVPDDLIVTGFDGIRSGLESTPTLTTVMQPMLQLGRAAVDAALRRVGDPQAQSVIRVLPVQVILRRSCGCRPADHG